MHGLDTIRRMNSLPAGAFVGSSERPKVRARLKWSPKYGLYRNSPGSCTYNPESLAGFSYRWWQVCGIFSGLPIFNTYRYSQSTAGHQGKLRQLFEADAPGPIIRVNFGPGLQKAGGVDGARGALVDIRNVLVFEQNDLFQQQKAGRAGSSAYAYREARINEITRDVARIDAVLNGVHHE